MVEGFKIVERTPVFSFLDTEELEEGIVPLLGYMPFFPSYFLSSLSERGRRRRGKSVKGDNGSKLSCTHRVSVFFFFFSFSNNTSL